MRLLFWVRLFFSPFLSSPFSFHNFNSFFRGDHKGVQDRFVEVLNFANEIFSCQNEQSDVKFTDYAEGFSEVGIPFFIGLFDSIYIVIIGAIVHGFTAYEFTEVLLT